MDINLSVYVEHTKQNCKYILSQDFTMYKLISCNTSGFVYKVPKYMPINTSRGSSCSYLQLI